MADLGLNYGVKYRGHGRPSNSFSERWLADDFEYEP
jgi:hypothetical protein